MNQRGTHDGRHGWRSRSIAAAAGMIVSLAAVELAAPAHAETKGDRALGEHLSGTCVTCHLLSGEAKAGVPPIVGWPDEQFVAIMKSYKEKVRDNQVMQAISSALTDEDIAALAAYFGSIKPVK